MSGNHQELRAELKVRMEAEVALVLGKAGAAANDARMAKLIAEWAWIAGYTAGVEDSRAALMRMARDAPARSTAS